MFEGDLLAGFVKTVEKHFDAVKVIKPKASRVKSSEMFLLAMNLKSDDRVRE